MPTFRISRANISPAMSEQIRKIITACFAIVRYMCWGKTAAASSDIPKAEGRTAAIVPFLINGEITSR